MAEVLDKNLASSYHVGRVVACAEALGTIMQHLHVVKAFRRQGKQLVEKAESELAAMGHNKPQVRLNA